MSMVYQVPEFTGRNISVADAARIMGKEAAFIREGMKQGILPIGTCFKKEGAEQYDYYISPKLFWEYTGYAFRESV